MKLFPIKVHCWGGFGSQLYALSLAIDLKERFPNRDLILCFHDSGVTQRPPEILGILEGLNYKIISDFSLDGLTEKPLGWIVWFKIKLRRFFKVVLKMSGVLSSANSDNDFSRIKPWIYSIRGHYSYRTQGESTVKQIYSRIAEPSEAKIEAPYLAVHYRLGDLTDLDTKQPISPNRIANQIILKNSEKNHILLFSDSIDTAEKLLSDLGCSVVIGTGDSIRTVLRIMQSKEFVGTSSKISYWAVIFRTMISEFGGSSLPISDKRQIEMNLGVNSLTRMNFY